MKWKSEKTLIIQLLLIAFYFKLCGIIWVQKIFLKRNVIFFNFVAILI